MGKSQGQTIYEIRVKGVLDEGWQQWFDSREFILQSTKGKPAFTTLTVPVADQAALRGILGKLWDLNLTLISLHLLESTPGEVNHEE